MDIYKKILLAVDGSEASKNAVRHAIELAKQSGGILLALHVVPTIDVLDIETFKPDTLRRGLRKEGEKILMEVKELAKGKGIDVQTRLEDGIPFEKICEVAGGTDSDLVVMGSHGRTGIGKVFIGSVTERVFSKIKGCPVLVVK